MKNKLPKLGLRNIKTAISVVICIVIFQVFKREDPFFACISAVICMQDTIDNSLSMGKDRLIGTLLGGALGTLFIQVLSFFPNISHPNAIIIGVGVVISIYICTVLHKPGSVSICCIVFIGIMIHYTGSESYEYSIMRTIDTTVGIAVAILVNKYINPPKKKPINQ